MPLSKIQLSSSTGRRNMVINGAMQVAQRGTNIDDISGDGQKNLDRMCTRDYGGNGTYDFDQSTDVPDSTFHNSLKLTVKSASTNTGSYGYALEHRIEGYNMRQLRLGRSTAQPITVSFYVKSSVSGTYSTGLRTTGGETSHVTEFTLSANTWKYVTYTAPAQTASLSSLDEGTGLGLIVDVVGLGKQTSKATSTLNAWQSGNYVFSNNQVAWMDNANATLFVTGLQVEMGNTATEFEHRPFAEELELCSRYFQKISSNSNNAGHITNGMISSTRFYGVLNYNKQMRAAPTVSGTSGDFNIQSSAHSGSGFSIDEVHEPSVSNARLRTGSNSNFTNGQAAILRFGEAGSVSMDSEL